MYDLNFTITDSFMYVLIFLQLIPFENIGIKMFLH